ncbi:MAG: nuclear transport factor 2 family protein [Phycisphaeraceae bacterium]|nr:nuclear transport factor 2 family protein [Phycisphaeraceae bacterium]
MPPTLPPCVADYFDGANKHDVDAAVAAFARDAVVTDEGHRYSGRDAVRE